MHALNFDLARQLDNQSSEAYKTLRTNIEFCGRDIKTIVVTSCRPNEGKSTVTLNLAISMADAGKKTVLIDADMRRSVMSGRYKMGKVEFGLSHYLSGHRKSKEIVRTTNIPNFDIICAGAVPPNPAELLVTEYFTQLLDELKESYDYIIIDSPPLGSVIDAAIIAQKCDGAILVIEQGGTSHRLAQKVIDQLERSDCKLLGSILNKVEKNRDYYNGYDSYYYSEEE